MKLFLDTTTPTMIVQIDEQRFEQALDNPRDQNLLALIQESLTKTQVSLREISEIEVNPGPGSFTGTRVGVTIANSLGLALGLLVNGQKPPLLPVYSSPPAITQNSKLKS